MLGYLNRLAYLLAPVFYKLLFLSLTAVFAGGAVLLVRKLWGKNIPPIWQYLMWGIVVLCLVMPWRPQSPVSISGQLASVQEVSYRDEYDEARLALQQSGQKGQLEEAKLVQAEKRFYFKSAFFDVILPLGWGIGVIGAMGWLLCSHLSFAAELRRGQPDLYPELTQECCKELRILKKIPAQIQPELSTPALTGMIHPRILLPCYAEQMKMESLRYVLLHELAHYKRKDLWVNELLLILQCVYWFNPLLWLLFKAMREDMEVLNDSYVLKHLKGNDGRGYARSLVEVLGRTRKIPLTPRLVAMTDGARNVERRIDMMKSKEFFKTHRFLLGAISLVLIAGLAVLFLTTGAMSRQEAAEQLVNSIRCENGVISFTIPTKYNKPEEWNIHISGQQEFPDGMSMSTHLFELENEEHKWEKGREYIIETDGRNYTELTLDLFLSEEVEKSVDLLAYLEPEKQESTQDPRQLAENLLITYYEQIYAGLAPDKQMAESCTPELVAYMKEKILQKQNQMQESGGFVANLNLLIEEVNRETNGNVLELTMNVQAEFQYPDQSEKSGFGSESILTLENRDGQLLITGWRMPAPGDDDFCFPND